MFRTIIILSIILPLAACNSVYVKPNSLDTSQKIYVPVGGYSMKRSIKLAMQNRGYNIRTGALIKTHDTADDSNDFDLETYQIPSGTKYSVRVRERSEIFRPIWCIFNGRTKNRNRDFILAWPRLPKQFPAQIGRIT